MLPLSMRNRLKFMPALLLLLPACYRYTPTTVDELAAGQSVRARISAREAERNREILNTNDRLLEGIVLQKDAGSVLLEVPAMTRHAGSRVETFNQRLQISRSDLLEVEMKRLDRPRTYALIGIAAIVGGKLAIDALKGRFGSETPPNPPGPADWTGR